MTQPIKVTLTMTFDDEDRRAIANRFGRPRLATATEAREWMRSLLEASLDDIRDDLQRNEADTDDEDLRPCPSCGMTLRADATHWSLLPDPMGGYICPTIRLAGES